MNFDSTYSGKLYQMIDGAEYTLRSDGKFAATGAYTGAMVSVVLTGWHMLSLKGNMMYQTTSGGWIALTDGWNYTDTILYSGASAQSFVNKIISCNKEIIQNNILCARFSYKLSTNEKQLLYELQQRLVARNDSLKDDGLVTGIETSYPQGYVYLESYLNSFMASGGVGLVISTTTIVIAALVVASLSTAAYFAYKYYASEAEKDVKYSKELTKVLLSKLTDEEYQQLMEETRGMVTKAKLTSKFGSYGKVLAFVLAAVGGVLLYRRVRQ